MSSSAPPLCLSILQDFRPSLQPRSQQAFVHSSALIPKSCVSTSDRISACRTARAEWSSVNLNSMVLALAAGCAVRKYHCRFTQTYFARHDAL